MMRALFILILLFHSTLYSEETFVLKSAETLNGSLMHINGNDPIIIKHIGNSKLSLNPYHVESIEFSKPSSLSTPSKAEITLVNGDNLKADIISVDEKNISFKSQSLDKTLSIPRSQIHKINYRKSIPNTIYSQSYSNKLLKKSTHWKFDNNTFQTNTKATMAQELPLTKDFVIKLTYSWTNNAALQILYGASKSNLETGAYYKLDLSRSKIQILQNNSNGANNFFLTKAPVCKKNMRQFSKKTLNVEIWVSRSNGITYLYLDGKLAQRVYFPLTPLGNHIGLICNELNKGDTHTVQNLKISSWDGIAPPNTETAFKFEKEISNYINGDSIKGSLLSAKKINDEMIYSFRYAHLNKSIIEKSESSLSTIYLNELLLNDKASQLHPILMKNEDKLSLTNLNYESSTLTATHKILGEISIAKKIINKITFTP